MGQTMRIIAIAKALQEHGHQIKYIAGGKMIEVIASFGFEVIEVDDMPKGQFSFGLLSDEKELEKFQNQMQLIRDKIYEIESFIVERENPDLLLCGTTTGPLAATKVGIPSTFVLLQPHGEKTFNMYNTMRNNNIGNQIREKIMESIRLADLIMLEGMPEIDRGSVKKFKHLLEPYKHKLHFTGPLLLKPYAKLPDKDVLKEKFIKQRYCNMVYVTIGGGSLLIGEEFIEICLDAFRQLPDVKAIIAIGIDILKESILDQKIPENVIVHGFTPGAEMIKASDVTVFHGGSSTLMTCIACGTPAVIIPSIGEQEDNAAVLVENGAGIALDKKSLDPTGLANAIRNILLNKSFRENAGKLKILSEKYGGAEGAAMLIEQKVKSDMQWNSKETKSNESINLSSR